MVERRTVAPDVAGSIPVTHPTFFRFNFIGFAHACLAAGVTLALPGCIEPTGSPFEASPPETTSSVNEQTAAAERFTTPVGTGGTNSEATLDKPYVILISFDGFRHDYLDRFDTPNFDRVAAAGARAERLVPPFPSLTFPAHYTVATGLYPERHGLVGNRFFDPIRGEDYNYRNRRNVEDGSWYGGEPIWVTSETQGMVSAAMLFVGTEADVGGVRPTFWTPYGDRGSQRERVDQVLEWLALPAETRPHLLTLYFSAVDGAGHRSGPASRAVEDAVGQVDQALGRLLNGLDALPHGDQVSLVLVADHGMTAVDPALVVNLTDHADLSGVRVVVTGPQANLFVDGPAARAVAIRDDLNESLAAGRAYLRDEVPETLRYGLDPRIGDVVVVPESGAMLSMRELDDPPAGMHGYDPTHEDMAGILLMAGPDIVPGSRLGRVESVHVYPLMAHLLRLAPNPDIDGELREVASVLVGR